MDKILLFFYGTIIASILSTGVAVYLKALFKEYKNSQVDYSNHGSD
jgi:hypothetical protein